MTFSCYKNNEHLKHIHPQQQEPGIELSEKDFKNTYIKDVFCVALLLFKEIYLHYQKCLAN